MIRIHPTAVVDPSAELGPDVQVGPYAVIGPRAQVGEGTVLGAHAVVEADAAIGRGNRLGVGVVIGAAPQHRAYGGERTFTRVGDRNVFGDYATVSRGFGDGTATEIGDDNFIMSLVRIDHNCRIGNHVVIVSGVGLAGYVSVDDQAYIGGQAGLHQFVRVGRLAMVGAMSLVRQDVPPFVLVFGLPARARTLNVVGLERAGIPAASRAALKRAFTILYRSNLTVTRALEKMAAEVGDDPHVADLIAFIRGGSHERGIVRWGRETSSP